MSILTEFEKKALPTEKAAAGLWADFAATGSVEAYLRYRRASEPQSKQN